jgi:hypothetical protein
MPANQRIIGKSYPFEPNDIYFSVGQMMQHRGVRRNIDFHRYTSQIPIGAIPWREDIKHLHPINDYDKILERYMKR